MEDTKQGVSEPTEEKTAVELALEESENQSSSPEENEDSQETSTEDENSTVDSESSEETELDDEEVPEGQAVPYDRFSKVNSQKKEYMTKAEQAEARIKQYEEAFNNADVLSAYLRNNGMTEEKISEILTQRGLVKTEPTSKDKLLEGVDLTTQEGWLEAMERMVEAKLTPLQQQQKQREMQSQISNWEKQAEAMAKERYNMDYSVAKKEMEKYLIDHPEDAGLGHPKILALAMSEKSFKAGEKQGIEKEKTRLKNLKASAIEGDGISSSNTDSEPGADASISELMAYARQHVK